MFALGLIGVALTVYLVALGLLALVCAVHQSRKALRLAYVEDPTAGSHGLGSLAWAIASALLWTVALLIVRFV